MGKWLLTLLTIIICIPPASAIALYGNWTYGSGLYGVNTPPTITAFSPSDTTPTYNLGLNTTFNITFTDYDGDTVELKWFVNDAFNASDGNLTLLLNEEISYSITANLTDQYDVTQQNWTVTIFIIGNTISINIEDFGIEWISFNWTDAEAPGIINIEISPNNQTGWQNITTTDQLNNKGNQLALQAETEYFFRAKNETNAYTYLVQKTRSLREGDDYYLYIVIFLTFCGLIALGYYLENEYLLVLAGMLSLMTGISMFMIDFVNLPDGGLKDALTLSLIGLGMYLIIAPLLSKMQEEWR